MTETEKHEILNETTLLDREVWKPIDGFEGLYEVSSLGRIKSLSRTKSNGKGIVTIGEKILNPFPNNSGYLLVDLWRDGIRTTKQVHRLVAFAFIPNNNKKPQIDHINAIRNDNRVCNLRWATVKENRNNPLSVINHINGQTGCVHGETSKTKCFYSQPNRRVVIQYTLNGDKVREWEGIKLAAKSLGICQGNLSSCLLGNRKSCGGYVWRYKK